MNETPNQLDAILAQYVRDCELTGDAALSLAEQFNRHLASNGSFPQQFPKLKEARQRFSWRRVA